MEKHKVTDLNNFIGGWYLENTSICDKLIDYFNDPSTIKNQGMLNGYEVDTTIKKSIDAVLDVNHFHLYMKELQLCLQQYIAKYPACNWYNGFNVKSHVNIQYYKPKDAFYGWHTERNGSIEPISSRHLAFMTYLNDVTDGGETEWIHQNVKIKPEKGLTLIWPTDWTFTHRGIPSKTQEKYIVSGWYNFT
jgi:hypothetical protein